MKKVVIAVLVLALLIPTAMSMCLVYATKPTEISGQWQSFQGVPSGGTPVTVSIEKAGANAFVTLHNYATYIEGPIVGTPGSIEQTIKMTFHYRDPQLVDSLPTGTEGNVNSMLTALRTWPETKWNWNVDRKFTGSVLGEEGSFTMKLVATGYGRIGNPVDLEGQWVITGGTEGLANLHGQGTWHSLGVQLNAYEGQVHFDP